MTPLVNLTQQEDKAVRLVKIIRFFEAGGWATAHELCDRFELNRRTVQRDIMVLSSLMPLVQEHGRYGLAHQIARTHVPYSKVAPLALALPVESRMWLLSELARSVVERGRASA